MNDALPTINERCFTEPYKAHELFMNTHTIVVVVVTGTQAHYYIDDDDDDDDDDDNDDDDSYYYYYYYSLIKIYLILWNITSLLTYTGVRQARA